MSKDGRVSDPAMSKQEDSKGPHGSIHDLSEVGSKHGIHSSMGAIKTIGESSVGPVRMSYYGTYNRVVMVAIDASAVAKYAFQCESRSKISSL